MALHHEIYRITDTDEHTSDFLFHKGIRKTSMPWLANICFNHMMNDENLSQSLNGTINDKKLNYISLLFFDDT